MVTVSIALKTPDFYTGKEMKKLAPTYATLKAYKITGDTDKFTEEFKKKTLERLDANEIVKELELLSGGKDVCLMCYEKAGSFCHRNLVANWITENTGIEIEEAK